jgi:hypothetical protein
MPWADVRHSHAEVDVIQGATVVTGGPQDDALKQNAGYSHIEKGNHLVLLVRDSDAKPGWMDSGSGEFLLVEIPESQEGRTWTIGEEARVWFWGGSAWSFWSARGISGTLRAKSIGENGCDIRVALDCERKEDLRPAKGEANERVSWCTPSRSRPSASTSSGGSIRL